MRKKGWINFFLAAVFLIFFNLAIAEDAERVAAITAASEAQKEERIFPKQEPRFVPEKISPEELEMFEPKLEGLTGQELTLEDVIADIKTKSSSIRDISFVLEKSMLFIDGKIETKVSSIQIKLPDKRKEVEKTTEGLSRIDIDNGSVNWIIQNPKSVYKTSWQNMHNYFPIPSAVPVVGEGKIDLVGYNGIDINKIQYKGIEDTKAGRFYILQVDMRTYWISVENGVIYKHVSLQQLNPVKITEEFKEVSINQQLEDKVFDYEPQEGAYVQEKTMLSDNYDDFSERRWVAPYKKAIVTEKGRLEREEKLRLISERYGKINDFSCEYNNVKTDHYMRVGKPGDDKAGMDYDWMQEATEVPVTIQKGIVKFKKPLALNYKYTSSSNTWPKCDDCFVITDGTQLWKYTFGPSELGPGATKKYVHLENVADTIKMRQEMMQSAERYRERAARFAEPDFPELVFPQEAKGPETIEDPAVMLPAFALEPLKDIDPELIVFGKEEKVNGEDTLCFLVKESEKNRKSTHWIGAQDGIPRKIQEYDWLGELVEREITLSNVKVNLSPPEEDFQFKNDGSYEIMDLNKEMPGMAQMLKESFDTPPETTYAKYFTTPLEDASEFKGSGMFFRGGEAFIRFKCLGKVVLKDEADFKQAEPAEYADYFIKTFPEDAQFLEDKDNLTARLMLKKTQDSEEGRVLLENKKEKVYFFRVWYYVD